jgi:hypothetical protein
VRGSAATQRSSSTFVFAGIEEQPVGFERRIPTARACSERGIARAMHGSLTLYYIYISFDSYIYFHFFLFAKFMKYIYIFDIVLTSSIYVYIHPIFKLSLTPWLLDRKY